TVAPAADPNRFLAPRATLHAPSDAFTLTAALPPGASAGTTDVPFTIHVEAAVRYTSRAGSTETFDLDLDEFMLPLEGAWPAGETVTCAAGQNDTDCMLESYVNSDFRLRVPRLDVARIN